MYILITKTSSFSCKPHVATQHTPACLMAFDSSRAQHAVICSTTCNMYLPLQQAHSYPLSLAVALHRREQGLRNLVCSSPSPSILLTPPQWMHLGGPPSIAGPERPATASWAATAAPARRFESLICSGPSHSRLEMTNNAARPKH